MNQISFGEIAEFRNGLNFGKDSHGKGCLLIGIPDFKDRFNPDYDSIGEINPLDIIKEDDYLRKNDILFVRSNGNKNLVGRSLYINKDIKAVFSGFCIRARLTSPVVDSLFCAYYTRSDRFKSSISSSGGTNIQNLNQSILSNVKLPLFSIETQKQIAKVLADLDAKIEVNNKINQEFEAMAKTLYDYWFVQFDFPDANGKPYKSSGGKMVFNKELKREIPEGWEVKELNVIAKNIMGQSPKGESYNKEGIGTPLLNGPADYENGALLARTYTTSPTRLSKRNDMVLCIRATIGNLVYSEQEFCLGRGVAAVRPKEERMSELIFYILLQEIERFKIQATGSIIRGITKDDLIESKCLIPSSKLIDVFHNQIKPIFDKIRINKKENLKLTELRDWLLPMLMNGQVTVGEAEEELGMVAEESSDYNISK